MLIPREYQSKAVNEVLDAARQGKHPVVALPTGCHRVGQEVLMYDGTLRAIESVHIGEKLMGPDSKPRTVLGLWQGESPMVEIRPRCGRPWVVTRDHVLTLVRTNEKSRASYPSERRGGEVVDIAVKDYFHQSRTWQNLHKLFHVGVDFQPQTQALPLDPYLLGVFLGDGTLAVSCAQVTKPDREIHDALKDCAQQYGLRYVLKDAARGQASLSLPAPWSGRENPVTRILRALGLMPIQSCNRFIPQQYLCADRDARYALLAGLMDTDGHCQSNGYDFVSKSQRLAMDTAFLARSLGLYASPVEAKLVSGYPAPYWRAHISGETSLIPCRIPRKQSAPRMQKKNPLREGFALHPLPGTEPYAGVWLDGDGRYLLGDFTVTHNSGKSLVAALIAKSLPGRVLVATHRKELLQQNSKTLQGIGELDYGIYSAGLGRKDVKNRVIFGGVASIHRAMDKLQATGKFDAIIVDEAHLVAPRDTPSMYASVLGACLGRATRIGLSATPYRLSDGPIYGPGQWFDTLACHVTMRELVEQGYLAPLVGVRSHAEVSTQGVRTQQGDFVLSDLSQVARRDVVLDATMGQLVTHGAERKSWIVFCTDVSHVEIVTEWLQNNGIKAAALTGKTSPVDRGQMIDELRTGALRALVNCEVATTGFDVPGIDLVAMLRPTMSKSLTVQMIGRGARLAPGKTECLVLDLAGNIARHQPLDGLMKVRRTRQLEEKEEKQAAQRKAREERERQAQDAFAGDILGDPDMYALKVQEVIYFSRPARQRPGRENLVVSYVCHGPITRVTQWLCIEYGGYATEQARPWFERRGEPMPKTARAAVQWGRKGVYKKPSEILVRKRGEFWQVIKERFEFK